MAEMTATERRELRALIRGRCKVMRDEISTRYDQLESELTSGASQLFHNDEAVCKEVERKTDAIFAAAMKKAQAVVDQALEENPHLTISDRLKWPWSTPPRATISVRNRDRLIRKGREELGASLRKALRTVNREEVALLEEISINALGESDAAKALLSRLTPLDALMPDLNVKELEK